MAKVFFDISGEKYSLSGVAGISTEEDIVSGEIVGYFVVYNGDLKIEVDKDTYQAIKKI